MLPGHRLEVELFQSREAGEEGDYVARGLERDLEKEELPHALAHARERGTRLGAQCMPAHPREPERRDLVQEREEHRRVVHPRVVLLCGALRGRACVVRAEGELAHAVCDARGGGEERAEAEHIIRVPEADVPEEVEAAAGQPCLADEAARAEGLDVVPEVVYGLIAELGRKDGLGYHDVQTGPADVSGGVRHMVRFVPPAHGVLT